MTTLLQGARAPESLRLILTPGSTGLDMRTVTDVVLHVTRPDRTTTTWPTTVADLTERSLAALHTFDSAGEETAQPGAYLIEPRIEPGSRRCRLFKLHVVQYPTP
jgi:hypothetical protein